jgi:hypothetical protein
MYRITLPGELAPRVDYLCAMLWASIRIVKSQRISQHPNISGTFSLA